MAWQRFWGEAAHALSDHVERADRRFVFFGIFGVIGYPLYGVLWTYCFPQPYENLYLRSVLSVICVGISTYPLWTSRWRRFWPLYWWFATLFMFPVFFSFMLLMNGFSAIWMMSFIAQALVVSVLVDWRNLIVMMCIGPLVGYIGYVVITGSWSFYESRVAGGVYEFAWVCFFVIGGMSLFTASEHSIKRARFRASWETGRRISHELRTPLRTIATYADSIQALIGLLSDGYRCANNAGLIEGDHVKSWQIQEMPNAIALIKDEAVYGMAVIDMFVANSGPSVNVLSHRPVSVLDVVQRMPSRFHRMDKSNQLIHLKWDADFFVSMTATALREVLINLVDNAMRSLVSDMGHNGAPPEITIQVSADTRVVSVSDNGPGIPSPIQPMVFDRWFSTRNEDGAGLGLAHCCRCMSAVGGSIRLESRPGRTVFYLMFPPSDHPVSSVSAS